MLLGSAVLAESTEPYLDGSLELEEDGLGDEDLAGLGAEITDLSLEELNLLARSATSHLE